MDIGGEWRSEVAGMGELSEELFRAGRKAIQEFSICFFAIKTVYQTVRDKRWVVDKYFIEIKTNSHNILELCQEIQ